MSRKLDILIDGNSLSHIAAISSTLNKQMPNTWLWKIFNVLICEKIKDEFLDGIEKAPSNSRAIGRKISKDNRLVLKPKYVDTLEKKWLHDEYYKKSLGREDAGERHLICTSAETVYLKTQNRLIIVTDDQTAIDGFMSQVIFDFKFAEIWTTLDLIAYMFYSCKEVTEEFAKDAIRDIGGLTSYSIKKFRRRGESEAEARLLLIKEYHSRINKIKRFKQIMPN